MRVWLVLMGPLVAFAQPAATNEAYPDTARLIENPGPAELHVPLASNAIRTSLNRALNFLERGHHEEAVDLLIRLVESSGDPLVPRVDQPGWIPVRRRCQQLLCSLPADSEALRIYRRQVDPLARQWLEQGREGDNAALRHLAENLLASSYGDEALLALGDVALQQGEVDVARRHWSGISPGLSAPLAPPGWTGLQPGGPLWPVAARIADDAAHDWPDLAAVLDAERPGQRDICGDTELPLAELRARFVLASVVEGNRERAAAELALLEALHPGAAGKLGGATGPLAPRLRQLLEQSAGWQAVPISRDWPMIGKQPRRSGRARDAIELGERLWSLPLEKIEAPFERLLRGYRRPGEPQGLCPYHVSATGDVVAVVEPQRVRLIHLRTGAARFGSGEGEVWRAEEWQHEFQRLSAPHAGTPFYDATIAQGRLFVRRGSPLTSSANPDNLRGSQWLAMDLSRQGRQLGNFPVVCQPDQPLDDPSGWSFDNAAPLPVGGHVFGVARWNDGVRSTLSLDCYEIATGRRRWRTRLAGGRTWAQLAQSPEDPVWNELSATPLAAADGVIYICTSLGVVSAVNAESGEILWETPYRRARPNSHERQGHAARGSSPCMVLGSLLIVAPRDTGCIIALDRFDGGMVWSTDAELTEDIVHLVGGDDAFVVAAGDRLHWIDARTGHVVCRFPSGGSQSGSRAGPRPRGAGRPLIAGETILWPTTDRLFSFRLRPVLSAPPLSPGMAPGAASATTPGRWQPLGIGSPFDLRLRAARGGHLSLVDDVLLIAGTDHLTAIAVTAATDPSAAVAANSEIPPGRD
ncbi:MAG: PQQ-binding-like beta-propeller repeat protein [Planctomycetales bacterium]|nr:PQQ-binding-like beta-propeller repeat protein [Planctomycetales bacterium]